MYDHIKNAHIEEIIERALDEQIQSGEYVYDHDDRIFVDYEYTDAMASVDMDAQSRITITGEQLEEARHNLSTFDHEGLTVTRHKSQGQSWFVVDTNKTEWLGMGKVEIYSNEGLETFAKFAEITAKDKGY